MSVGPHQIDVFALELHGAEHRFVRELGPETTGSGLGLGGVQVQPEARPERHEREHEPAQGSRPAAEHLSQRSHGRTLEASGM